MIILAVESSCDEMSVAIKKGKKLLTNVVFSQIDLHTLYGGVVPELASRAHIEVVVKVINEALVKANLKPSDIDLVAATQGPGLIGSLMIGMLAAETFAMIYHLPFLPLNHLEGHIYASAIDSKIKWTSLILLISGGHTELIYAKKDFVFETIGTTLDDAIGESYDKVARVLNLGYPGGPIIDKLSVEGNKEAFKFPIPMADSDNYDFSFSGLKSAVINKINYLNTHHEEYKVQDIAASFQEVALESILLKVRKALTNYKIKRLIVAGGVAANKGLRLKLKENFSDIKVMIPPFKYCTDNAAMIAECAFYKYKTLSKKEKLNLFNYGVKPFSTKEENHAR